MGLLPTPDDDALSAADLPAADPPSRPLTDPPSSPLTDLSSLTDPAAPFASPAAEKVPLGPANPGVVRSRHKGVLARLPLDCDILEEFARLRRDHDLSDEQVILKLITTYEISMATLNRISSNVYPIATYLRDFFSQIC